MDLNYIDSPLFNPGGVKDRVDTRDFQYAEIGFGTPPFNWAIGFDIENEIGKLPVKDQGTSFSCGGQAWATYASVLEAAFTGTLEERSAKFIYAQTYQNGGGSRGRDNAEIYVNQGIARESVLSSSPNIEANMTRGEDITAVVRLDALFDKSFNYSQVEPANIDEIARAIRDNNGVVLGIDGQNGLIPSWASETPQSPTQTGWRHWCYAGKAFSITPTEYEGWKAGIINYNDLKQKYGF